MKKQSTMLATICITLAIAGCNKTADTSPTVPTPAETDASMAQDEQQRMDKDTLLTVNGEPVTKAMYALYFQERMRNVPEAQNSPELQMRVLNELANVIIAAQDAEKKGIDERPEINATLTLMRAKLLTQTVIQEYVEKSKPNENQIKTYYEAEYASQSGQEYKARHILVKEEANAKSLIEKLDGGADFAELAKENSTGPTGPSGGDLGWFDAKQMVKPFADAVTAMTKGSYSKEPVQTQFGWHVIKLEDTRETEAPTLDGVRGEIISKLQQQSLSGYMQGLRTDSKIVFNNDAVSKPQEAGAAETPAAETTNESTDTADAVDTADQAQAEPVASETQEEAKPANE